MSDRLMASRGFGLDGRSMSTPATAGNAKLRELVKSDLKYARKNFRFTLLEYRAASTPENIILDQEDSLEGTSC